MSRKTWHLSVKNFLCLKYVLFPFCRRRIWITRKGFFGSSTTKSRPFSKKFASIGENLYSPRTWVASIILAYLGPNFASVHRAWAFFLWSLVLNFINSGSSNMYIIVSMDPWNILTKYLKISLPPPKNPQIKCVS